MKFQENIKLRINTVFLKIDAQGAKLEPSLCSCTELKMLTKKICGGDLIKHLFCSQFIKCGRKKLLAKINVKYLMP